MKNLCGENTKVLIVTNKKGKDVESLLIDSINLTIDVTFGG